jgi:hypothetical protein
MSSAAMVAPILASYGNSGMSVNLFGAGRMVIFRCALEPANYPLVRSPAAVCMTSGGLVGWIFDRWGWQV